MKAEKALPASLDNSRLPQIALVALVVLLGVAFFLLTETVPNISDTIGYVYAGERLANGDGPTFEDPNNQVAGAYFSLYAFQIERPDDPRFFLGFPPGFPLLLALGQRLGGPGAIHYVVPLLAVAGLAVTYGLARLLGGNAWTAVWSALVLALTPAYWEFGTAAWSEMPAMVVMVGGICFYLLSRQPGRTDRQVHVFSLLAAVLIGYSFFIRYANVSVLPALVLYELAAGPSSILRERRRWSFYGLIALALGAMLLFNQVYYGGWQQTSYSPAHGWYPQSPFSLAYAFGPSFVNGYSLLESFRSLVHNFSFLLLLVPIGWMLLPRRSGLLAAAATLATLGLYAVYAFAPTGINSRFLLPAYPFLALAIGVTVSELGQRLPGRRWRAPATVATGRSVLAGAGSGGGPASAQRSGSRHRQSCALPDGRQRSRCRFYVLCVQ